VRRNKANGKFRNRIDEILFIDARNMGHLINRRTKEFSDEDIAAIAGTYHNWRATRTVTMRMPKGFATPRPSGGCANWTMCSRRGAMWAWPMKRMISILRSGSPN